MVTLEKKENFINIVIVGQLEYEASEELLEIVKTKMAFTNIKNINIDLSRVNYINSIGIGTIVTAYKILKEKGKELVLLNPQDNVLKIIKLTKINEIIKVIAEGEAK